MLRLENLSKSYAGRTLYQGLSADFAAGECVAIMGESGVGKSTLLNIIAGLDQADAGRVLFEGEDLSTLDDAAATRWRRRHMGFVFQAFHVLPHLTLAQNVALPLLLNGMPLGREREMLAAVGLAGREQDFPRQLSGGELQRVAVARALVHQPRLLLADEPTGNLDPETGHTILQLLRNEAKISNSTILLVTHSPAAARSADKTLVLTGLGLIKAAI